MNTTEPITIPLELLEPEEELVIPLPLSPSTINMFFKCPKSFWYKVLKFPRLKTDTSAADVGTLIHKTAEEYFRTIYATNKKLLPSRVGFYITEIFEALWKKAPVEEQEEKARQCLDNFIYFEQRRFSKEKRTKNILLEKYYRHDYFHGYIDWFDADTGIVRDWKTSKSPKLTEEMYIQGLIYKAMLEQEGFKVNQVIFEMLFTGKSLALPRVGDNWLYNKIKELLESVKLGKYPKRTSWLCDWCSWQIRCFGEDINLFD